MSQPTTGVPSHVLVHDFLTFWATMAPDQIAAEDERGAITYAELNARASQFAGGLSAAGMKPLEIASSLCPRTASIACGVLRSFPLWRRPCSP